MRSQGAGNRTSISALRQWAEIHIARLGTGAGGGTDPRAGIEAADPINSARRGRSKPRPPPARAARRAEIYARASSFGPKEEYARASSFGPKEQYMHASSFGPKEEYARAPSVGPKEEYARTSSFGPKEEYARASSFGPEEENARAPYLSSSLSF